MPDDKYATLTCNFSSILSLINNNIITGRDDEHAGVKSGKWSKVDLTPAKNKSAPVIVKYSPLWTVEDTDVYPPSEWKSFEILRNL